MDQQTYDTKRAEIFAEYNSNMSKSDARLDELREMNRDIEDCCDRINNFQQHFKYTLEHHKSELAQHDSTEDFAIFNELEEEIHADCRIAETALLDEKEENEREHKKIFREQEDYGYEYKSAIIALDENAH